MDFGVGRFLVQVFQQQQNRSLGGIVRGTAQAIQTGLLARRSVGRKMKSGVDNDPPGAQQGGGVDVGCEIRIDGVGNQRGVFRDVDGGKRVQAEANSVVVAGAADRMCPGRVEAGDDIGASIQLNVDDADVMLRRPVDRVLQREFAADVDADTVERNSGHGFSLDALFQESLRRGEGDAQTYG
jgi:hypothetical protein